MRAFILGNSGELLDHDLSLLDGEMVFGLNALPLKIPEIITHYVCMDVQMAFVPEVRSLIAPWAKKYYSRLMWNAIYAEDNVNVFDTYPDNQIGFELSDTKIYPGKTVSFCALQIAAYLGFNPIYMLGVDLGLPANGISHIPEQDKMREMISAKNLACPTVDKRFPNPSLEDLKKVFTRNFIYAKGVLDEHNIEVINLSRGGNLNCFPRDSYEKVLSKEKANA